MMERLERVMSDLDSEDSGDGSGDSEDMPTSFVFFGIAMLMVGLRSFRVSDWRNRFIDCSCIR